jgi:hypothetical protein
VFGGTVNNKSLVSETPYSVERQLNCCEVTNEGDDADDNNNNLQFLLTHLYLTLFQHQPKFLI